MEINEQILDKLKKINLPGLISVRTKDIPEAEMKDISIEFGQDKSYLCLFYFPQQKQINFTFYNIEENLRGEGYGRKLVEGLEALAKSWGCNLARVGLNRNPSFWKHLGYTLINDSAYKNL